MGPRQREIGIVMVKTSCSGAIRVAFKTCLAVVYIAPDALVFLIHIRLQMRMAINAAEDAVI